MIRYYLCVDDTDDLTKKTSTGKIAEHIKKEAESLGSVIDYGITRHQLLLDDAIAYTSHNSSMCFSGSLSEGQLSRLWEKAAEIIMAEKAETADPGLCLCRLDQLKFLAASAAHALRNLAAQVSASSAPWPAQG